MSNFEKLIEIVKRLRAPDGCPWDKEQTFKSLTPYIIEEAYELVDAIENDDFDNMKEELGDALLHVVMLSNMAEEESKFNVDDVAKAVSDKMIHRHPHVFGDTKVSGVDDVWKNWEELKKEEKKEEDSVMDSVPNHFPALLQANKIQKRAARLGFDWDDPLGPFGKIEEEVNELKEVVIEDPDNKDRLEDEAGDVLFVVTNILRKLNINPEEALRKSNQKFIKRFKEMERLTKQDQTSLSDMNLDEIDVYWKKAKKNTQ